MSKNKVQLYLFYDGDGLPPSAECVKLGAASELFLTNFSDVGLTVFHKSSRGMRQWMSRLSAARLPAFALFPRRPRRNGDPTVPFIAIERPVIEKLTEDQLYHLFSDLFFAICDGVLELPKRNLAEISLCNLFPPETKEFNNSLSFVIRKEIK